MEEKKGNEVSTLSTSSRYNIISRFKDLIDIGPMLQMDWEEEMSKFKKKLQEAGWGEENINEMIAIACSKSIHLQGLPSMPRDRGNWLEWLNNRGRIK